MKLAIEKVIEKIVKELNTLSKVDNWFEYGVLLRALKSICIEIINDIEQELEGDSYICLYKGIILPFNYSDLN